MLELFRSYKAGVWPKGVWQKKDKQDNLEQDKEDKRIQTIQYKKDKKDNLKQDKDELELGLWMLQLHAEGDGNSVRAFSNDICSVVGYYAMLCKLYSKMKMCEYTSLLGGRCKEEALLGSKYCILHVDLPEDEESDIRDFHVGCIHCNIRTGIYAIIIVEYNYYEEIYTCLVGLYGDKKARRNETIRYK